MTFVPAEDPFAELPVLRTQRLSLRRITESDTEGLFDIFSDGVKLDSGHENIHAVVLTAAEQVQLHAPPGAAAFAINRLGRSHGRPVEWRHTLVRGDRFALTATFTPRTGYQLAQPAASEPSPPG